MSSQTTRIDFYRVNINADDPRQPVAWGYLVRFFARGWDCWTTPYRTEIDPLMRLTDGSAQPFDLATTLDQLAQSGWTVRRWATGARAWRGQPEPVRTRAQIVAMRRRQTQRLIDSCGQPEAAFTTFIDYAYEG